MNTPYLKPCPFCGHKPWKEDLLDVLYPTATFWRYDEEIGCNTYFRFTEAKEGDNQCWKMVCNESHGGCGAEMDGDSEQDVINKWNRRDG
jgi:hypothetical protein